MAPAIVGNSSTYSEDAPISAAAAERAIGR
jgi:hypothetical protein